MSAPKQPDDAWRECRPGELGDAIGVLRTHKRNRTIVKIAVLTTAALVVVMVAGYAARQSFRPAAPGHHDMYFAGISCTDVKAELPQLHRGVTAPDRAAQVRSHLKQCPNCRAAYQKMLEARAASQRHTRSIALLTPDAE